MTADGAADPPRPRNRLEKAARRAAIELAARVPRDGVLRAMSWANEIQLSPAQLRAVAIALRTRAAPRFLVFGLGNDSPFWNRLNRRGTTLFLEDDRAWFAHVLGDHEHLRAHRVDYRTIAGAWELLLARPHLLALDLPEEVTRVLWDVILVDAPAGWNATCPGRMKSIRAAARLVTPGGDVFVHDCERRIEAVYADHFLGATNLVREVPGTNGLMRHYRMTRTIVPSASPSPSPSPRGGASLDRRLRSPSFVYAAADEDEAIAQAPPWERIVTDFARAFAALPLPERAPRSESSDPWSRFGSPLALACAQARVATLLADGARAAAVREPPRTLDAGGGVAGDLVRSARLSIATPAQRDASDWADRTLDAASDVRGLDASLLTGRAGVLCACVALAKLDARGEHAAETLARDLLAQADADVDAGRQPWADIPAAFGRGRLGVYFALLRWYERGEASPPVWFDSSLHRALEAAIEADARAPDPSLDAGAAGISYVAGAAWRVLDDASFAPVAEVAATRACAGPHTATDLARGVAGAIAAAAQVGMCTGDSEWTLLAMRMVFDWMVTRQTPTRDDAALAWIGACLLRRQWPGLPWFDARESRAPAAG